MHCNMMFAAVQWKYFLQWWRNTADVLGTTLSRKSPLALYFNEPGCLYPFTMCSILHKLVPASLSLTLQDFVL